MARRITKKGRRRGTRRERRTKYTLNRKYGGSPNDLIEAIKSSDISEVKILLKKGADVNFVDKTGLTPLFAAIMVYRLSKSEINKQIIELLLEKYKSINFNYEYKGADGKVKGINVIDYSSDIPEIVKLLNEAKNKSGTNLSDNKENSIKLNYHYGTL
jgi:ankyrin repeat protein